MELTIDFETRSGANLGAVGAHKYAEHPLTRVLCLAVKVDDEEPKLWLPPKVRRAISTLDGVMGWLIKHVIADEELIKLIKEAEHIEAHNMQFERAIWEAHMNPVLGIELPLEKCYCSEAVAAMMALPRSLDLAAKAVGCIEEKDKEGSALMMKMCKPWPLLKAQIDELSETSFAGALNAKLYKRVYKDIQANDFLGSPLLEELFPGAGIKDFYRWHETPEQLMRLAEYCMQDVNTEREFSKKTVPLPPQERKVWLLDTIMNERGIPIDMESVSRIVESLDKHKALSLEKFQELTGLNSPKQTVKFLEWVKERGKELPNMQAATVDKALKEELPEDVRTALELRKKLGKSSVDKFKTLLRSTCEDGRIRGTQRYHGGRTGRWSGKRFQPHNLIRKSVSDPESFIDLISEADFDLMENFMGLDVYETASWCVRPMVKASSGNMLRSSDFSGVEARGLAWLSGSEKLLQAFRDGKDVYVIEAAGIFGKPESEITSEERLPGKVVVLACGYQGHIGAFQSMAKNYGLNVPDERAGEIVKAWRKNNIKIAGGYVRGKWKDGLWQIMEKAALKAVKNPGVVYSLMNGKIRFGSDTKSLKMRLPSGRFLYYAKPHIRYLDTSFQEAKETLCYWGVSSQKDRIIEGNARWGCLTTYGGKLTENAIQALCRDIYAEAILRLEANGFPVIFGVHDEPVCEVETNEAYERKEEFVKIITEAPEWAKGFPIDADEGWIGPRYRKG